MRDDSMPIGLTGARFDSNRRRRREPEPDAPVGSVVDRPSSEPDRYRIGLTGARFARRFPGSPEPPRPARLAGASATPAVEPPPPGPVTPSDLGPPGDTGWDRHDPSGASVVRPYVLTRGRTRSEVEFRLDTLVSTLRSTPPTAPATRTTLTRRTPESAAVVELCRVPHALAEIAALTRIPVGVAQVLVGDLVKAGVLVVHHSDTGPDLALMERVLRGLQHLR